MTLSMSTVELEGLWLTEYWYAACASSRLRRKPLAVRLLDHDIVVFRCPDGTLVALADRCPHRGVELSLGRVTAQGISCRYHGWRFDSRGRCVDIPSLVTGRIPQACRVSAYECIERDGYVWVWPNLGTTPGPVPSVQHFASRRWVQGTMMLRCSWVKAVENNLDWCHPAFVHRWTHPQFFVTLFRGQHENAYEVRPTDTGLVVFAPPTERGDEPIPNSSAVRLSFELPNRVTVQFGRRFGEIVLQFVPTGPDSCRMEWMTATPIGPRLRWSKREGIVNRQDRRVLESAQRSSTHTSSASEISVRADASTLSVRRVITAASTGRWPLDLRSLPRRRVIGVKT